MKYKRLAKEKMMMVIKNKRKWLYKPTAKTIVHVWRWERKGREREKGRKYERMCKIHKGVGGKQTERGTELDRK